jgi:Fe-S-cluster containining protein
MPGPCAPGDIEAIAQECGVDLDDQESFNAFLKAHFSASEGAIVMYRGKPHRIPTIVPAQSDDGRCVFLSDEGRCTVHRVTPFGCSRFRVCEGPEEATESEQKAKDLHHTIAHSDEYLAKWAVLCESEKKAVPVGKRLRMLSELCGENF